MYCIHDQGITRRAVVTVWGVNLNCTCSCCCVAWVPASCTESPLIETISSENVERNLVPTATKGTFK